MRDVLMTRLEIQGLVVIALTEAGLSRDQAESVARSIADCECDGCRSHGLFRLSGYLTSTRNGKINPHARPRLRETGPTFVHIDADRGVAPLAHDVLRPVMVGKARQYGICLAAITNCLHFSALWTEAQPLADAGLAVMIFRNGVSRMAPHGGVHAVFGTNPFAFAWPRADGRHVVFDFATSAASRGDIALRAQSGKAIPEGWAISPDGSPTTDAETALAGTLLPFGGHKGALIAMMIELLSGPLIGSPLSIEAAADDNGDGGPLRGGETVLALAPEILSSHRTAPAAGEQAEALFRVLEEEPGVRLPAERRYSVRGHTEQNGVPVDAETLSKITLGPQASAFLQEVMYRPER